MEYSPDVVYFFNKSKTKSFIFTFLNELLDKTKYVIHSLGFDKNLIITTPWEFLSQLVIFDMIDFEDLKNCHDKIVNYIHIKRGKVWINHSSKDIENYIITYKDEFSNKQYNYKRN
ncbi:hypothetical protein HZS_351 [Henneguya salminicola]|nr:hypothetical protein HZS_351 [Henneguya salminicola]